MRILCMALLLPLIVTSPAFAEDGGWLLMRPVADGGELRTDEPIARWQQVGTFDSPQECMQEKLAMRELMYDRYEDADAMEAAAWTVVAAAIDASRCVPAKYVHGPHSPSRNRRRRRTGWPRI